MLKTTAGIAISFALALAAYLFVPGQIWSLINVAFWILSVISLALALVRILLARLGRRNRLTPAQLRPNHPET